MLYNTVFGAKPLEADGRAFYYSDYNFAAKKTYFPDKWPCCSGTLPQVTADYRIMIYLRDRAGIFVNLYLPSTLRFVSPDGAQVTLTQSGSYPIDSTVLFRMRLSQPSTFALRLRIPAWSDSAGILVNHERAAVSREAGFASLSRRWKDGDVVEMNFPLRLRLEAIDSENPGTVALVRGPVVLFATAEHAPSFTREELLRAMGVANETAWQVKVSDGAVMFRPFSEIRYEPYTTYVRLT